MTPETDVLGVATVTPAGVDSTYYRRIFTHLPTAVVAITGITDEGEKLGMVVGTFQSLSLNPPLVMFCVDKSSSTWPRIRKLRTFTANLLADDQVGICRALSRRGPHKLDDVPHRPGPSGIPHIDDVLVWLDCTITAEVAVGDHFMVVGAVTDMTENAGSPLLFLGREFGRYQALEPSASIASGGAR